MPRYVGYALRRGPEVLKAIFFEFQGRLSSENGKMLMSRVNLAKLCGCAVFVYSVVF